MKQNAASPPDEPISPEFVIALRSLILSLIHLNGGYAKVQIEIVGGQIRRFESDYDANIGGCHAHVTEPYLMKNVS